MLLATLFAFVDVVGLRFDFGLQIWFGLLVFVVLILICVYTWLLVCNSKCRFNLLYVLLLLALIWVDW